MAAAGPGDIEPGASPSRGTARFLARGTPAAWPAATMADVGRADSWRGGWAGTGRRIAAVPHPTVLAGIGLGLLSVAERIVRLVRRPRVDHQDRGRQRSWQFLLLFFLLSLATTLPLAFLGRSRPRWPSRRRACCRSPLPDADRGRTGCAARRLVPARPRRRAIARRRCWLGPSWCLPWPIAQAAGPGSRPSCWPSLGPAAALAGIARRARARRSSTARPGRLSRAPCWSTPRGGNAPGSPASCMTWSRTTSP